MTETVAAESGTTEKPAKAAPHACACLTGTGQTCDRLTSKVFAQGHDARMASRLAQAVAANEMTKEAAVALLEQAGGSELLIGKMVHSADLRKDRKSGTKPAKPPKADKEAAPAGGLTASADEAGAVASAGGQLMGSTVKVTHKDKTYDAVVVKTAGQEMVARHRLIGTNCDHSVNDQGVTGPKLN